MRHQEIAKGLKVLLEETRSYANSLPQKVEAMQESYLQEHKEFYTKTDINELRYHLKATNYKFYLATLNLEQLWSLSEIKRQEVLYVLENSLDRLECSDDELLLISYTFEGFLFQSRAFLDFYMLYVCLFLKTGHEGRISNKKFYRALDRAPEPFTNKASTIKKYFDSKVFADSGDLSISPKNWGELLRSLRDKIAHRDKLRPSFDSDETLIGQVLFDWPTLRETTYDRFCQSMQNGMFYLYHDLSPLLYELEWKPGPYHPDLWQD